MIKQCFINIKKDIVNNIKLMGSLEKLYWIAISFLIVMLGYFLNVFWVGWIICILTIFGIVVFKENRTIVLMISTLFFTIISLSLQNKGFEANYRPYLSLQVASEDSEQMIKGTLVIENTGNVPANNVRIKLLQIISGTELKNESKTEHAGILFPKARLFHYFSIGGDVFKRHSEENNVIWEIYYTIIYDGISTKNHISELKFYYDKKKKAFATLGGKAT